MDLDKSIEGVARLNGVLRLWRPIAFSFAWPKNGELWEIDESNGSVHHKYLFNASLMKSKDAKGFQVTILWLLISVGW